MKNKIYKIIGASLTSLLLTTNNNLEAIAENNVQKVLDEQYCKPEYQIKKTYGPFIEKENKITFIIKESKPPKYCNSLTAIFDEKGYSIKVNFLDYHKKDIGYEEITVEIKDKKTEKTEKSNCSFTEDKLICNLLNQEKNCFIKPQYKRSKEEKNYNGYEESDQVLNEIWKVTKNIDEVILNMDKIFLSKYPKKSQKERCILEENQLYLVPRNFIPFTDEVKRIVKEKNNQDYVFKSIKMAMKIIKREQK